MNAPKSVARTQRVNDPHELRTNKRATENGSKSLVPVHPGTGHYM